MRECKTKLKMGEQSVKDACGPARRGALSTSKQFEATEWQVCPLALGWARNVCPTDIARKTFRLHCNQLSDCWAPSLAMPRASPLRPRAAQPRVLSQSPPQHWSELVALCHIARLLNRRTKFSLDTMRASLNKSSMLHDETPTMDTLGYLLVHASVI